MRLVTAVCVWTGAVVTVSLFWERGGVSDDCGRTKKVSARAGYHFHVLLSAVLLIRDTWDAAGRRTLRVLVVSFGVSTGGVRLATMSQVGRFGVRFNILGLRAG